MLGSSNLLPCKCLFQGCVQGWRSVVQRHVNASVLNIVKRLRPEISKIFTRTNFIIANKTVVSRKLVKSYKVKSYSLNDSII